MKNLASNVKARLIEGDVRFTLYRLRVAQELPESDPSKVARIASIKARLENLESELKQVA